jgi:hypothetical protein
MPRDPLGASGVPIRMRYAVLGGALLLMTACGAYQFPGSSPSPAIGNVSGRVISIPCGPVQPADNACAGRAVGGVQITFTDGQTAERTTTDANGRYSIDINPGTYKVTFNTYMRIVSGPSTVTVSSGANVIADYVLDNGIRKPIPQA